MERVDFRTLVKAGNASGAPRHSQCPIGCPGLHLTPLSGKPGFTYTQLMQACIDLASLRPTFRMHARGRSQKDDSSGEMFELGRFNLRLPVKAGGKIKCWFDRGGANGLENAESSPLLTEANVCLFLPVTSVTKEDCWQLARFRKLPQTGPTLWKTPFRDLLRTLELPQFPAGADLDYSPYLTGPEESFLHQVQGRRTSYLGTAQSSTVASLKQEMTGLGIPCSSGMTRGGMVDALIQAELSGGEQLPSWKDLDLNQSEAVALGLDIVSPVPSAESPLRELLISAGPGAGKTTTVTNLLAEIVRRAPSARVLVLAFNVEAESILKKRLARLGLRRGSNGLSAGVIPKPKVLDPMFKGCAVMTFDKMAYQICAACDTCESADAMFEMLSLSDGPPKAAGCGGSVPPPAARARFTPAASAGASEAAAGPAGPAGPTAGTYRDTKERAAVLLQQKPEAYGVWDLIVVDEAQDVTQLEANIVEGLLACSVVGGTRGGGPGLVAAGDPRQEVYPGASWYSTRWSLAVQRNIRRGAAAPATSKTHVLSHNYRSSPEIVAALNAYSRAAFPTLHHDQIAVRPSAGDAENPSVRILEVGANGNSGDANQLIGQVVGGLMAKRPPGESYGLVPVSLEKFKVGAATAAARQTIHEHRPAELTLALTGDAKASMDAVYLLATSRRIKGTEKPLVVVYAIDRDYDILVDNAALAKLVYVALSRARDELVLVTQRLARQRIKTLIEPFISANLEHGGQGVVTADPPRRSDSLTLYPVPVTGESLSSGSAGMGVCQLPYGNRRPWTVQTFTLPALPAIHANKGDHDFVGQLSEAHVARAIQTRWVARAPTPGSRCATLPALASPRDLRLVVDPLRINHGLYLDRSSSAAAGGGFVLCTSAEHEKQLTKLIYHTPDAAGEGGVAAGESDGASAPYVHAMLKFTALCGRPWTVSSSLAHPTMAHSIAEGAETAADAILDLVSTLVPDQQLLEIEPLFWSRGTYRMAPCRPAGPATLANGRRDAPVVAYETDAIVANIPVELKYTTELTADHERQLFSYMVVTGSPTGVLYNARTGETRVLSLGRALDLFHVSEFMCRARALLACRAAQSARLQHLAPYAIAPPAALGRPVAGAAATTTAIALDLESDEHGLSTEIGAVAVSLTDWSVLGTFQERVPSANPITGATPYGGPGPRPARGGFSKTKHHIEQIVGLRRTVPSRGQAETESAALEASFRKWCSEMSSVAPVYLHWGGSEKNLLGEDAATVDVYQACFMPWLELKQGGGAGQKARQGNTNLSSAMQQLLPHLPFVAHQAFEDALAALAILQATVDFGGKL
jgi:hypothetical protein